MKINNAPITDSTTFLHTYFFSSDTYSADVIDRDVDGFVIRMCLNDYISVDYDNGKRVYRINNKGKRVIGR